MTNKEMTYYRLYLKDYLLQQGDSRANDDDFINDRSDKAEEVYEQGRHEGLAVWQAHERAIHTLTSVLDTN